MTREQFDHEMRRARTISQENPDKAAYYSGYMRGLRIAYNGGSFGVDRDHNRWMNLIYETNTKQHDRGLGYRDGLQAAA
jgi:hypothetical protein